MISHIVLFRPKPSLSAEQRQSLLTAIATAARSIPSVVRFTVGQRLAHGRDYGLRGKDEFPYFAQVEVTDHAGLADYMQHPAHQDLGRLFRESLEAALVVDYETVDAVTVPNSRLTNAGLISDC